LEAAVSEMVLLQAHLYAPTQQAQARAESRATLHALNGLGDPGLVTHRESLAQLTTAKQVAEGLKLWLDEGERLVYGSVDKLLLQESRAGDGAYARDRAKYSESVAAGRPDYALRDKLDEAVAKRRQQLLDDVIRRGLAAVEGRA
jgi:hypothetical protein